MSGSGGGNGGDGHDGGALPPRVVRALERFQRQRTVASLDHFILTVEEELVRAAPMASAELSARLRKLLGDAVQVRYQATGDVRSLERAIDLFAGLVAEGTGDPSLQAERLNDLGEALRLSLPHAGKRAPQVLDRVIQHVADATELDPEPGYATNLGNAYRDRYLLAGDVADLDRAIEVQREALRAMPEEREDLPRLRNVLATALRDRFKATGREADLDAALDLFRWAAEHAASTDEAHVRALNGWGVCLDDRYQRHGRLEDLDRAIERLEQAVCKAGQGSMLGLDCLNNLGNALRNRFEAAQVQGRREARDLILRAVKIFREVVDESRQAAPRSTVLASRLSNLGNALRDLYELDHRRRDLERALEAQREAVVLPAPQAEKAFYFTNLGNALYTLFRSDGRRGRLDDAIAAYRGALELTERSSPDHAGRCHNLGLVLLERSAVDPGAGEDRSEGEALLRSVLERQREAPQAALLTAREWAASLADRGDWGRARELYGRALQLAEGLLASQVLGRDREARLRRAGPLMTEAADAYVRTGAPQRAVEVLEAGRTRWISEELDAAWDLPEALDEAGKTGLRTELAHRERRLRERLRRERLLAASGQERDGSRGALRDEIRTLRQQRDALVADIRAIPGCERFRDAPTYADVVSWAGDRRLVYLFAARHGGAGLVVLPGSEEPLVVELPDLRLQDCLRRLEAHFKLYGRWRRKLVDRSRWLDSLDNLCRWIGERITAPLTAALAAAGQEAGRLALIPCGVLGLLPLHAGWIPHDDPAGGRRYTAERLTLSYLPCARMARRQARHPGASPSLLAVVCPDDGTGADVLDGALTEVELLAARFEPERCQVVRDARRADVVDRLGRGRHEIVHFACHGTEHQEEPLDIGLRLAHGERFLLRDLLGPHPDGLRPDGLRLAVLSACETGLPGLYLPDEVIGLPAGWLLAGASSVVASSWVVDDLSTSLLMVALYDRLASGAEDPAVALHQAMRWMRRSDRDARLALLTGPAARALPRDERERLTERLRRADAGVFHHPHHWAAFACYSA